ncbi:hypothetical protein A0J51_00113 [Gluconobacter japonicus]|nr:hypothetical protein A0J51_00113 [Gluconobacter japonicus]
MRRDTAETVKGRGELAWEPEWDVHVFHAFLKCLDPDCHGTVSCHGMSTIWENSHYEVEEEDRFVDCIEPKNFYPSINYFKISDKYPERVKEHLSRSFSSYWNDLASSLNALRTAVEAILDDQGIESKDIRSKPIFLVRRIEIYMDLHKDTMNSDLFAALRIVGNEGSHSNNEPIEDYFVMRAFDMTEILLKSLYDDREKTARAYAKSIVDARKPPKIE